MTTEQRLDSTVVVLVLWIYVHLIILFMPAAELREISDIRLSLFILLQVYFTSMFLSVRKGTKFNPEDYCDVDLNNLGDLYWYKYDTYASEERKRRDDMTISCIVAVGKNNVIGKDNDIPWYLPADLQYFKKTTLHAPVIMGRNCYVSIGRPLPKRTNIIVTRDMFFISSNCVVCRSIPEALHEAYVSGAPEAFIIGGGQIYEQTQDLWDKVYITHVDIDVEGDVFFPEINTNEWELLEKTDHQKDEKNEYDYSFLIYQKKK